MFFLEEVLLQQIYLYCVQAVIAKLYCILAISACTRVYYILGHTLKLRIVVRVL